MTPLWNLGDDAVGLSVSAAILLAILWLGWRKPTLVLMGALASLALRPELLWGGPELGYHWNLHHTLIVFGLAMNALRYGVRLHGGWPIPALVATFLLGLAFGDLHPKLTLPFMLMSLAILAIPFTFTQVLLAPGSRRAYALVIMLTPVLSVAIGGLLQLAGMRTMFDLEAWTGGWFRLSGATGNPAVFAVLAFAGFAVALHEMTRPGRPYAGVFAVINLALMIVSGTRMAILASGVFFVAYVVLSDDLRALLRANRVRALIGGSLAIVVLAAYLPTLQGRMFRDGDIQLSLRDELWAFYFEEFLFSPWFGRGFGAGFVAAEGHLQAALPTPHDEYLHLLVIGGVVGLALCAFAIVHWYRALLQVASRNDRKYALALALAVLVFAVTDNVLVYSSAWAIYASLGLLLTRPFAVFTPARQARRAVIFGNGSARGEMGS